LNIKATAAYNLIESLRWLNRSVNTTASLEVIHILTPTDCQSTNHGMQVQLNVVHPGLKLHFRQGGLLEIKEKLTLRSTLP